MGRPPFFDWLRLLGVLAILALHDLAVLLRLHRCEPGCPWQDSV